MKRIFHVYILSNISKMPYIGVTNNLERRILEHKNKLIPGFSQKYNLHRLVYFESFGDIRDAIVREKQLKGWLRVRKVELIKLKNPNWDDLAADWFKTPKATKERPNTRAPTTKPPTTKPLSS
jgi:putative endonuclease